MPDLRLLNAEPSEAERIAIDAVLGAGVAANGRSARDDRTKRHLLLPALRAAQQRVGWVSEGALGYASRRLAVPPAEAYGVATFYALIALEERPADVTHVCTDLSCALKGATVPEGALPSPCLGLCERTPAAYRTIAGEHPVEEQIPAVGPPLPQAGEPGLRLLRRIAAGVDPESIDAYIQAGGFESLRRAQELGPEAVLHEVTESRLLGRGGAAFPTGVKWAAVAKQPALPHYVVCNADESEPGTFKDRVLMEQDPFALIESMAIAALATGSSHGFIYVRAEYPLAHRRLQSAIDLSRSRGFLEGFDIELRIGAGAYVCGEETALFASIEGFRGEPRNKPPFPVNVGVFGKPTVINNVETLINVLDVVLASGPAYAATGTEGSTGTKLFCLSGHVVRPGVYEVPFGATLRELLELAGGVVGELQTILMGGAAGGFLRPDELDLVLTFEAVREAKTTLGSGVVMVMNETVDLPRMLQRIAAFFRNESCGQCTPCRVGTVRQQEALARLCSGRTRGSAQDELVLIGEIGMVMRDASICGLGQTASAAIESAIDRLGVFS